MLRLCLKNNYSFTFSILKKLPKNSTLNYYDLRQYKFPDLFEINKEQFCKQVGIVLYHDRVHSYEVGAKRTHRESYQKYHWKPNYPRMTLPPLIELLQRDVFPQHDKLRFQLLKWMIDEVKLHFVDLSKIPRKYCVDILVLVFMTSKGFIDVDEADLILLSIKHVELQTVPQDLPPVIVHPRAFHISFLFTKIHQSIKRCLEITGLRKSMGVRQSSEYLLENILKIPTISEAA